MKKFMYIPTEDGDMFVNVDNISYVDIKDSILVMTDGSRFEMKEPTANDLINALERRG